MFYIHTYREGEGKKYGNNVVSSLMNNFKEMRYFSDQILDSLLFLLINVKDKTKTRLIS